MKKIILTITILFLLVSIISTTNTLATEIIIGKQKQILRVSHRSEHAAKVCRHSLQHNHPDKLLFLMGKTQHNNREGDKGQQRHIVCNQHGAEKTQQHQCYAYLSCRVGLFTELVGKIAEHARAPQPADDHHQRVKQRQCAKVNVFYVVAVDRNKYAA